MLLDNLEVLHKSFGKGIVVSTNGQYFTVKFENCQKIFVYPDIFDKFLTLADGSERTVEGVFTCAHEMPEWAEYRFPLEIPAGSAITRFAFVFETDAKEAAGVNIDRIILFPKRHKKDTKKAGETVLLPFSMGFYREISK